MAHIVPDRVEYTYRVATNPDGNPFVGRFTDGSHYYNVISVRRTEDTANPVRIVARTMTLEDAQMLTAALNRHTVRP
jgi:hypothetical protein